MSIDSHDRQPIINSRCLPFALQCQVIPLGQADYSGLLVESSWHNRFHEIIFPTLSDRGSVHQPPGASPRFSRKNRGLAPGG